MTGFLNVFKPPGMTSHTVVAIIRRLVSQKRVGHAGTLDPQAMGVLPICVGKATRLSEYLVDDTKKYRTLLRFGVETDTQDQMGNIVRRAELPTVDKNEFTTFLSENFTGEILQIPPMYSAIKRKGKPLYKYAREGIELERKARKTLVHSIDVIEYRRDAAILEIECGKGTYIRTLCHDIGSALGSAAYMSYLLRMRVGRFTLAESQTLTTLKAGDISLLNPQDYLSGWEVLRIAKDDTVKKVLNGNPLVDGLPKTGIKPRFYALIDKNDNFIAVGSGEQDKIKIVKVIGDKHENIS